MRHLDGTSKPLDTEPTQANGTAGTEPSEGDNLPGHSAEAAGRQARLAVIDKDGSQFKSVHSVQLQDDNTSLFQRLM